MANHRARVVELCKAEGWYTETKWQYYHTDVTNCIYTQSGTFRFFLASWSVHFMLLQLQFFWFNWSTWSFIMASRARQTTMIIKMLPAFPFIGDCGKSWKIKLFPKLVGRTAKTSSIDHIFMQSFCSLWRHLTWGKSFSMLFITDLNTAAFFERSLISATSHIASVSVMLECWKNLLKLTNQRV